MSVRPEIAALIAAGYTDTGIAARLGIDRTTANRARTELRRTHLTAPTGAPPPPPPEKVSAGAGPKRRPWTTDEQARHRADLLAALNPEPAPSSEADSRPGVGGSGQAAPRAEVHRPSGSAAEAGTAQTHLPCSV